MKKTVFFAALELLRPANCAMAAFDTILGYWLSVGKVALPFEIFLLAFSSFCICGAGQAINDYYDAGVDSKGKKGKPIPSGLIASAEAKNLATALFILGIAVAFLVNMHAFGIAVAFSVLLCVYSHRLSRHKYFGNAIVALSTAFTFIMGATLTGNYGLAGILAAAAFFASWAREIAKDLEDFDSDRGKKTTLPMVWGKKGAAEAAKAATLAAIFFGLVPLMLPTGIGAAYYAILGLCIGLFLVALLQMKRARYRDASATYKYAMAFAMAAFASTLF